MRVRTIGILATGPVFVAALWGVSALFGAGRTSVSQPLVWGRPGRKKPGTFDKPRCVAVAPDGSVYCLDLTGRIQHFTAEGKYLGQLQMPDVSVGRPQGIDVGEDHCVYVADTHYNQVVKFSPAGEIVLRFGTEGTEPGSLFWPCAIAVAEDGCIYTAQYGNEVDRIQKWSPTGELLCYWGSFGEEPGQFMRPMGLALDRQGNVYVADAVNHRVQVFTGEGKFLRQWGLLGKERGAFTYPYDIAIDSHDRVYTVEYGAHRVQCFTTLGKWLADSGTLGKQEGGLNQPWGLDVSPGGIVYVADTYNYRVSRVSIDPPAGTAMALLE